MYPLSPSDRGGLKTRAKEAIRGTSGVYLVTILYLLLTNLPDLALYRGTIATMLRSGDPEVMLQIWTNRADSLGAGAALVSTLLSLVLSIIEYSYSQYSLRIGRGVQVNKTDANDALGLAQVVRTGWYREVAVKGMDAQELRMLLVARAQEDALAAQVRGLRTATLRGLGSPPPSKARRMACLLLARKLASGLLQGRPRACAT